MLGWQVCPDILIWPLKMWVVFLFAHCSRQFDLATTKLILCSIVHVRSSVDFHLTLFILLVYIHSVYRNV